ncbi:TetR/AcrR family transcriptional regulator [Subtercola sp. YIM 133946]|uniref:TetR/AcrR family transcriptional regulator n=1 Tax=Subtercola sp. YIM 133946 TaxID=3118909 RepID=UPI002F94777A
MSDTVAAAEPLTVRKKRRAQQSIVEAADELFRAHGFENVSVTDIASRAEVGRTTFFRYFGDKAEVVFAQEQRMLDLITERATSDSVEPAHTAADALDQLRPIVLELCRSASADPAGCTLHYELIAKHLELRARDALKTQLIADRLSDLLIARGTEESVAIFAAQIALACAQTARRRANNPQTLVADTRAAFDQVHLHA